MLIAFPLPNWLHERFSVLRVTYIACFIFDLTVIKIPVAAEIGLWREQPVVILQ